MRLRYSRLLPLLPLLLVPYACSSSAPEGPDGSTTDASTSDVVTADGSLDATNPEPVPSGAVTNLSVTVTPQVVGNIGPSFCGLSLDKTAEAEAVVFQNDSTLVTWFQNLGPSILRIGGTDVDFIPWVADGGVAQKDMITRADVDALAAFVKAANWQVLYGINLITSTPELAADEAAYAAAALGSHLYGFEIGNEPDLYTKAAPEAGITDEKAFYSKWMAAAVAIHAAVPGALLTGPALGNGDAYHETAWMQAFLADTQSKGPAVGLATQHYYPGFGYVVEPDGGYQFATLQDLLDSNTGSVDASASGVPSNFVSVIDNAESVINKLDGGPIPLRIDETNSFIGRGNYDLPADLDTSQGAALWMIDHLFVIALAGGVGANIIASPADLSVGYSPFGFNGGYGLVKDVRPEYYGMLLFTMAGTGKVLGTTTSWPADAAALDVTAYTVQQADGSLSVIINNKDGIQNLAVNVDIGKVATSADLYLLTAPSLESSYPDAGQTLQGATVAADAGFTPQAPYTLTISGNTVQAYVAPASAALIRIKFM